VSSGKRFVGYARGGVAPHAAAIRALLETLEGKQVVVTVDLFRKKRSDRQNRYYFGVVVADIREAMQELGNTVSPDDVHYFLKSEVAGMKSPIYDLNGEVVGWRVDTSTKLTTQEFENYMEQCRAWAAEHLNIIIDLPNEGYDY
jgi:hypothetical protein